MRPAGRPGGGLTDAVIDDTTAAAPPRDLRRERLALAVRSTGPARRAALADLVERALAAAWRRALPGSGVEGPSGEPTEGVALAVVGSVARRDAGPASDLDLVLLHDGRRVDAVRELADRLWYPLWDSGLRLDHSVRTLAQCRDVAAADLSAAIGLLDLRPLAGDASLVGPRPGGAVRPTGGAASDGACPSCSICSPSGPTVSARRPTCSNPTSRRAAAGCGTSPCCGRSPRAG